MAAIVFVTVDAWLRQFPMPKGGKVVRGLGANRIEAQRVDADIGDRYRPTDLPARHQEMTGFAPEESDGLLGDDGAPKNRAGAAVNPARQIYREDRQTSFVGAIDDSTGLTLYGTVEPRAEKRVD